jgi:hypothetical protein
MLFGSTMLEVVIGMIFVYLLMSLLCSAFSELIASIFKFRAKGLEKGIKRLLSDPQLSKQFFNHPLVKPLYADGKPSYVTARTFSRALWNLATEAATPEAGKAGLINDLAVLRGSIANLPEGALNKDIRKSILIMIDEAKGNFDKARENIEGWYDDAMDRVSGWYKRRIHAMLIIIGLVAAAAMNVDSINIANTLSHNQDLRTTVVAAAENYAKTALPEPTPQPSPQASPQPSPQPSPVEKSAEEQFKEANKRIGEIKGQIDNLGLPIGWVREPQRGQGMTPAQWDAKLAEYRADPRRAPDSIGGWLLKALGIFLTAMAISQGAPFWFDLLNKIVVVRSTVKPHEKSPEQPSKDKPAPETEEEKKDEKSKG